MKNSNYWPVSEPKKLIRQVFRVIDFDRSGAKKSKITGKLKPRSFFKPYGYLMVQTPDLEGFISLPIVHKDDFMLASFFFDDEELVARKKIRDIELLVTYIPEKSDPEGFSVSPFHCLHYAVCSFGTFEKYVISEKKNVESLFGEPTYQGNISLVNNLNES